MFNLIAFVIFVWLLVKSIGLMFRLTWGLAKVIATVLIVLAVPGLLLGVLFAGGIALLMPVAAVAIAFGILSACV